MLQHGAHREMELSFPASVQGTEHSGSPICIDLHKFAYPCTKRAAGKEEQKDSRVLSFSIKEKKKRKPNNPNLLSLKHFII